MARRPSVLIVLYRQSNTPLYRLPVWLYMRDMMVSVGQRVTGALERLTWRMHDAAHDKATRRAARQVQRQTLLHVEVLDESALREEICGKLHGAAESCPHHRRPDAAIESSDFLGPIDLAEAVDRVLVVVLGSDGEERRERLQACLDKEEGRPGCSSEDTRGCSGEDVDAQRLDVAVLEDGLCDAFPEWFVEAQPAAIQQDLVNVGRPDAAEESIETLVLCDDRDTMEHAAILADCDFFGLELALKLEPDLDGLERVGDGDRAARSQTSGDEGAKLLISTSYSVNDLTYPAVVDINLCSCGMFEEAHVGCGCDC